MKLTISKEQLINGLQAVQNIVGTRTTMPVLSNVLMAAEGNRLALTTTDLDITIACAVEAKVHKPGAATVPVKRLFGIIRELPAAEIEIEVDEKFACNVQAGASYYKINGLSPDDFPPLQTFSEEKKVVVPQDKFRSMLRKTGYAISLDEARYVLNGIFISMKENKVVMVATDGRRLALAEEDIEVPLESQHEFIVPSKAVSELTRLLQTTGQVEIKISPNQVAFTLQDEKGFSILVMSKLIEGNYPNYRQVIPTETKERIAIGREELLQSLHRAEFMTSDKSNSVKLTFGANNLSITANSPEVGEGRESIAVNYHGREIAIAFNPIYLMDPLKILENDEVFFDLTDELSPALLRINGPFLYVLMPMRTN
jgi:DNA polymerase-3 subunit beta